MFFRTTAKGTDIILERGNKSEFIIIVRYKELGKPRRTPKHIHLVIDLFNEESWKWGINKEIHKTHSR